jgi:pyrrolidone-carboxylate peptidase
MHGMSPELKTSVEALYASLKKYIAYHNRPSASEVEFSTKSSTSNKVSADCSYSTGSINCNTYMQYIFSTMHTYYETTLKGFRKILLTIAGV